ncbi:heme exporter protein CcmB [Roseibium sp. M-1]
MSGWAVALFRRDLRLAVRVGGSALVGVLFFLAVVTVIPFGVGPDLNLLARIGPAILWIGALLATLLGLDRLFQADREDGTLDLMLMAGRPLELLVLIKCAAHWVATGLPLVVAAPLLGIFLNLDPVAMGAVTLTLLVGTPALTLIGAIGAALTVSLRRGGLLLAVLVIPLAIPVLIFGVSSADAAIHDPVPFLTPFLILCALSLIAAVIGPVAAATALRFAGD